MTIPNQIEQNAIELREGEKTYSPDNGGQWIPGTVTRIEFRAAVLPLSESDLRYLSQGMITTQMLKLYTSHEMESGTKVELTDGTRYTVMGVRSYNRISLRRYYIERKG